MDSLLLSLLETMNEKQEPDAPTKQTVTNLVKELWKDVHNRVEGMIARSIEPFTTISGASEDAIGDAKGINLVTGDEAMPIFLLHTLCLCRVRRSRDARTGVTTMLEDGEDELKDLHPPTEVEGWPVGLNHLEKYGQTSRPHVQLAAVWRKGKCLMYNSPYSAKP